MKWFKNLLDFTVVKVIFINTARRPTKTAAACAWLLSNSFIALQVENSPTILLKSEHVSSPIQLKPSVYTRQLYKRVSRSANTDSL